MHLSRRDWHALVVGGLVVGPLAGGRGRALAAAPHGGATSALGDVQVGVQSYSFRDRPLDAAIAAMRELGIPYCELWQGHIETREALGNPDPSARREALRRWRLSTPLDVFEEVRAKFARAGIALSAYNISIRDDYTDEEITRGFEMARALSVGVITASSNVSTARRLDPVAKEFGIRVGFHNHSIERPDEFRAPVDFRRALDGASSLMAINLDIGHFTAANFDPVSFLDEHHDRIVSLHLKDRRRNEGPNVPFGEGDTPIRAVLERLRDRRWAIPAHVEYEYEGRDTIAEVRRSLAYCGEVLAGSQAGGWRTLFDGTSLDAWRGFKSDTVPAGWRIVDGTLSKDTEVGDLVTRDQFGDFELELEWRIGEAGNSGIFYRGTEEYTRIYWSAPEYQLLDDINGEDNKARLTCAGAAYALYPSPAGHLKPVGEWNRTRILARGAHVEHWLNGTKLLEFEQGSADWNAKVQASKFNKWTNFGKSLRGHLALQGDHAGTLAFRSIRIRELSSRSAR